MQSCYIKQRAVLDGAEDSRARHVNVDAVPWALGGHQRKDAVTRFQCAFSRQVCASTPSEQSSQQLQIIGDTGLEGRHFLVHSSLRASGLQVEATPAGEYEVTAIQVVPAWGTFVMPWAAHSGVPSMQVLHTISGDTALLLAPLRMAVR